MVDKALSKNLEIKKYKSKFIKIDNVSPKNLKMKKNTSQN